MSMSKQDFIALADALRPFYGKPDEHTAADWTPDTPQEILGELVRFCRQQNHRFMEDRWLGYLRGENGKNGGKIK